MQKHILVVDDEEDICEILKFNLQQAGFIVDTANSAEEALTMNLSSYHLILLDVMMGEMSGFRMASILKKSKNTAHIPIIFCTAKSAKNDTVEGFDIGADDYISKPFFMREVVARVHALLRRCETSPKHKETVQKFKYKDMELDITSKKVIVEGNSKELTKTEFELLKYFLEYQDQVFSRDELLDRIWPNEVYVNDRTIDVHIARLRKKIIPYGKYIISRSGYGYCFETA